MYDISKTYLGVNYFEEPQAATHTQSPRNQNWRGDLINGTNIGYYSTLCTT